MFHPQALAFGIGFVVVAWLSVRAYLHLYQHGVESRRSALKAGVLYLVLGMAGAFFFEVSPNSLGDIGFSDETATLLKLFFSVGVAAMAGNFLVSAVLLPTKEQESNREAALARKVAEALLKYGP